MTSSFLQNLEFNVLLKDYNLLLAEQILSSNSLSHGEGKEKIIMTDLLAQTIYPFTLKNKYMCSI